MKKFIKIIDIESGVTVYHNLNSVKNIYIYKNTEEYDEYVCGINICENDGTFGLIKEKEKSRIISNLDSISVN